MGILEVTLSVAHRLGIQWLVPSGVRPWKTPDGILHLDISESPMMFLRLFGRYETPKRSLLTTELESGDVFVDVGANRGDFTMLASRIVGDAGEVISVEPAPDNVEWLKRTVAANNAGNVRIVQCALWDSEGEGTLHLARKSGWHSLTPADDLPRIGTAAVRLVTLDSLLNELGIDRVDALKIDVEGAEVEVLRGAKRVLRDLRPLVVMDIDAQRTAQDYRAALEPFGYEIELAGGKELVGWPR